MGSYKINTIAIINQNSLYNSNATSYSLLWQLNKSCACVLYKLQNGVDNICQHCKVAGHLTAIFYCTESENAKIKNNS